MNTVLIIDDEDNLRRLLARVIELEGYTVYQAATVKDGLKHKGVPFPLKVKLEKEAFFPFSFQ